MYSYANGRQLAQKPEASGATRRPEVHHAALWLARARHQNAKNIESATGSAAAQRSCRPIGNVTVSSELQSCLGLTSGTVAILGRQPTTVGETPATGSDLSPRAFDGRSLASHPDPCGAVAAHHFAILLQQPSGEYHEYHFSREGPKNSSATSSKLRAASSPVKRHG
eukprot:scaffold578_cov243-Pinguiococcus_pyrenoidosus.AAC.21